MHMKKIDILTNDVFTFLVDHGKESPNKSYTPEEISQFFQTSGLAYSEAQVYGALRRLLDENKIQYEKDSRTKKYKCVSLAKKSKVEIKPESDSDEDSDTDGVVPNKYSIHTSEYVKTLPSHMGSEYIERAAQNMYIELLPLTKTANDLITKHGAKYKLLIMSNPPPDKSTMFTRLYIQSMNETMYTGKNGENKMRLCTWIEVANKNWKNHTALDEYKQVFDYRIVEA